MTGLSKLGVYKLLFAICFCFIGFQHAHSASYQYIISNIAKGEVASTQLHLAKGFAPVEIELVARFKSAPKSSKGKVLIFVEVADSEGIFFGSIVSFSASQIGDDIGALSRKGSHTLTIVPRNTGIHNLYFSYAAEGLGSNLNLPELASLTLNVAGDVVSETPPKNEEQVEIETAQKKPKDENDTISIPEDNPAVNAPQKTTDNNVQGQSEEDESLGFVWPFTWFQTALFILIIFFVLRRFKKKKSKQVEDIKWGRAGSETD